MNHTTSAQMSSDGDGVRTALKRRGLIAGAAALAAGILATRTSEPVLAASLTLDGPNTVFGTTTVTLSGVGITTPVIHVNAGSSNGTTEAAIAGIGGTGTYNRTYLPDICGVLGVSGVGTGVMGQAPDGQGVWGVVSANGDPLTNNTAAVRGDNHQTNTNNRAVQGTSDHGIGILGVGALGGVIGKASTNGVSGVVGSTNNYIVPASVVGGTVGASNQSALSGVNGYHATNGNGVYGLAGTSGNGVFGSCAGNAISYGVYGLTDLGNGVIGGAGGKGTGVYGSSTDGNGVFGATTGNGSVAGTLVAGVYGFSNASYGILGSTTAAGYSGLTATTSTAGVAALAATALTPSAFAAYFSGLTYVQGDLTVTGAKHAAVMHPDGTHRLFYCTEAPEPWFEDYGEGKLVSGKAEVALDPEFALFIHTDAYHVFLTPRDANTKGLAVTAQGTAGFSVRELQGGAGSLAFSWRVVGKRKDVPGKRLEKFVPIKYNIPDPDKLPKPAPPKHA